MVYTRSCPPLQAAYCSGLLFAALAWTFAVQAAVAQATRESTAAGVSGEEPRYARSTRIPEEMIRRRPRQVITLPSEPGEYGEDPLQLSSGVLGKLPPDVHRLPEGYVVANVQMSVQRREDWTVCFLPDERLAKLAFSEAGGWASDLNGRRVPPGLVKACQEEGVQVAAEAAVAVEEHGRRWRVSEARRTIIVEKDRDGIVIRRALVLRILPNKRLAVLEAVLDASDRSPSFAFTGRITEFQGSNYILIEQLAEVIESRQNGQVEQEPPAGGTNGTSGSPPPQPDTPSASSPDREPRPEDIIHQLLERKPRRAVVLPRPVATVPEDKPVAPGSAEDGPPDRPLRAEETMIVDQPGRLVPSEQWYTFTFEDKGRLPSQRPIRLLPNRMLEDAIALTGDKAAGVVLIVSGEVTEYRGNNYLLLRKLLVQRDWGNLR